MCGRVGKKEEVAHYNKSFAFDEFSSAFVAFQLFTEPHRLVSVICTGFSSVSGNLQGNTHWSIKSAGGGCGRLNSIPRVEEDGRTKTLFISSFIRRRQNDFNFITVIQTCSRTISSAQDGTGLEARVGRYAVEREADPLRDPCSLSFGIHNDDIIMGNHRNEYATASLSISCNSTTWTVEC